VSALTPSSAAASLIRNVVVTASTLDVRICEGNPG
jgi:hypothetical protein